MSVWDWIDEFAAEASARGDRERLALVDIHPRAYGYRHSDPPHMLALLEDGRRRALALNEPWWVLFFDHWCLETLIYYQDDYRTILDRAVRLTLDLRRPIFEQHPLRFHAHCNLLAAYLCTDPRGHAAQIAAALEYLSSIVPEEGEEKYLLTARYHWFAYEMEQVEEAARLCQRLLEYADLDSDRHLALHHSVGAHLSLCRMALAREDWFALEAHAGIAEELANQRGASYDLGLARLWVAVSSRQRASSLAPGQLQAALVRFARLKRPADDNYHDALAAYHELDQNVPQAIQVRLAQLERLRNRGQVSAEAETQLHLFRLRALAGLAQDAHIVPFLTTIQGLGTPEYYRERLEQILAGRVPTGILRRRV